MFSCEADKYQATQQNVEFTLIRNFTMDSIDFRDLEESYFIDIPIAFTDSVEKVSGKSYNRDRVNIVNLTKCYFTLNGVTGVEESRRFGFLNSIEMFVEGMAEGEIQTSGLESNNRLYYGAGGNTSFISSLEDNMASVTITVIRSADNTNQLPLTANCEVLLEFNMYVDIK